jgi:hypothetical protein
MAMATASARRSFHGPLVATPRAAQARRAGAAGPLELVPPPPSASSVGRAVLASARAEEPTRDQRERVLAGVLDALKRLTSANR